MIELFLPIEEALALAKVLGQLSLEHESPEDRAYEKLISELDNYQQVLGMVPYE